MMKYKEKGSVYKQFISTYRSSQLEMGKVDQPDSNKVPYIISFKQFFLPESVNSS